jgi:hypothetical protein
MTRTFAFVLTVMALLVADKAHALQQLSGHITVLESTYMPTSISFQLDVGNAACPAGKWLKWTNTASMQATYSTMLAALLAGRKVNFFINDNDATCTGQFFHVTTDL